ncbi:MAG: S26 family signal peptidase [Flavobacteriales bacterium]|nr:S26 family signal peptidase [Flavobacteriales bacterium]
MNHEERTLSLDELKDVGRHLLDSGQQVEFRLGGNSMFPFLRNGDMATVVKVPMLELKHGQVVVFAQQGKWIAHRLIALDHTQNGSRLVAQGDSIVRFDKPIAEHDYLGIIVGFVRNGRSIEVADYRHRLYGRIFVKLRPFPQALIRLYLKINNRWKKKKVHRN